MMRRLQIFLLFVLLASELVWCKVQKGAADDADDKLPIDADAGDDGPDDDDHNQKPPVHHDAAEPKRKAPVAPKQDPKSTQKPKVKKAFHYSSEDPVPVHVLKVGPYANPSETYDYYSLPVCAPSAKQPGKKNFKEAMEGARPASSPFDVKFRVDVTEAPQCTLSLTADDVGKLRRAVLKDYYFEIRLDGIPLRSFLGATSAQDVPPQVVFYKHLHFSLFYNDDQIIYGNITADLFRVQELRAGEPIQIDCTYSVQWFSTNQPFRSRLKLLDENFFSKHSKQELEIHWLSIMNSFVLVVLLTGFVALIIMRVLKGDYSRYARAEADDETEDYGWKLVHGDVFRFPPHKFLFCALVGNGAQFFFMAMFLLTLEVVGVFYGTTNSFQLVAIVLYAFTAGIAGFVSAMYYRQMGGEKWAWNLLVTTGVFAVPFFALTAGVNLIAAFYGTTTRIEMWTIVRVLSMWLFIGVPLTFTGGIIGKRFAGEFYAPVRTKNFKREIPPIPWYRRAPVQYMLGGFLPFSAIYIELYYVYAAVWGHHAYTLYSILFLVFVILIIVTACITIALTYFQLSMEDYEWWWRSFISGGSTGFFIFLYSIFHWIYRSKMTGMLQATFYFGYMTTVCYFFFIMLGTVGWYSSLIFVRRIYQGLKCD